MTANTREISQLEKNLDKCQLFLKQPFDLEETSSLEDIITEVNSHLKLLADAFVPANLSDDEASIVLDKLLDVKNRLRSREKEARTLLDDVMQVKLNNLEKYLGSYCKICIFSFVIVINFVAIRLRGSPDG